VSSDQIRKLINLLEAVEHGQTNEDLRDMQDRLLIALSGTAIVGWGVRLTGICAPGVILPIVFGLPLVILGLLQLNDKNRNESVGASPEAENLATKICKYAGLDNNSTIGDYFTAIVDLKDEGKLNDSQVKMLADFNSKRLTDNLFSSREKMEKYGIDPKDLADQAEDKVA